jgi:hypothetical protein
MTCKVESKDGLAMSLKPQRQHGDKSRPTSQSQWRASTKSTLVQRAEDSYHNVEKMGNSRGQVRLTGQLLQGLYTL